jgi:hypothetical protein
MAETLGEIRAEVSKGLDWQRYVQRYPEAALAAAGAVGWIIGRKLSTNSRTASFDQSHVGSPTQFDSSSRFARFTDQVVSVILNQVLAVVAGHFKDLWSNKVKTTMDT